MSVNSAPNDLLRITVKPDTLTAKQFMNAWIPDLAPSQDAVVPINMFTDIKGRIKEALCLGKDIWIKKDIEIWMYSTNQSNGEWITIRDQQDMQKLKQQDTVYFEIVDISFNGSEKIERSQRDLLPPSLIDQPLPMDDTVVESPNTIARRFPVTTQFQGGIVHSDITFGRNMFDNGLHEESSFTFMESIDTEKQAQLQTKINEVYEQYVEVHALKKIPGTYSLFILHV